MSLERYREDLDKVIEEAFSAVEIQDPLEADIRKRLATLETKDTVEKINEDEVEEAREDVLEKLDETFEELAVERQRLEGKDIEREDLGVTTTEAHIIDGFREVGAAVQEKYRNVREFMESTIGPSEIAGITVEAYLPGYSVDDSEKGTSERLVDHFYERITENGMTPEDIEPDDIPEALRNVYTEEEYRLKTAEDLDPTSFIPKMAPDLVSKFEEISAVDSDELVEVYLEKVGEFGEYASEKMKEVFPYDTADDIWN